MKDITKELEELGLRVNKVAENVYTCKTEKNHLIVCYYAYNEDIEDNIWCFEISNINTINGYIKLEWLLEALSNYLGLESRKK